MQLSVTKTHYLLCLIFCCILVLCCIFSSKDAITHDNSNILSSQSKSLTNSSKTNMNSIRHNWANTSDYDNTAQKITNSISTSQTIYFASNGDDQNSGLDPQHPKKNPTDYFRNGNCTLLFKSGDVFTLNFACGVSSNIRVSTYGGTERAVITWVPVNSSPFQVYDANQHIYSASLDQVEYSTDDHYKVAWVKLLGDSYVNWHKVFSYSELTHNKDFFSDSTKKVLYIKSDIDLSGKKFAFSRNQGGLTIRNGSNCSIENLEIVGAGLGINVNNFSNVVIKNCFVHHVGGVEAVSNTDGHYSRYGNGIQVWATNTNNIYIYNNYVTDCFDAGITPQITGSGIQPSDSIYIYNNYIDRCLYNIEFFEGTKSNNVPLTNVVIQNNILTNSIDITGGYRYATYGYTSYFCLWAAHNKNTRFIATNNFGYGTTEYAFAFYEASPSKVFTYNNNTLIISGKKNIKNCVKNYQFYTGEDSEIILSTPSTIKEAEAFIRSNTSRFNKKNLFFDYLDKQ